MRIYKLSDIFLFEAKIDLIKKKYPKYSIYLDFFKEVKPKYIEWIAKEVKNNEYKSLFNDKNIDINNNDILDEIKNRINIIEKFDNLAEINLIPYKDIGAYKDFEVLEINVTDYEQRNVFKKSEEKKKKDVDKIYEDQEFLVLIPKTKEASCKYGKGTKWCISASEENQFLNYTMEDYKFLFIINKNTNDKWAITYNEDEPFIIEGVYDNEDTSIPLEDLFNILPSNIINIINKTTKQNKIDVILDKKKYKFIKHNDQLYVGFKDNGAIIQSYFSISLDENKHVTILNNNNIYYTKTEFEKFLIKDTKVNIKEIINDINQYFGLNILTNIDIYINSLTENNIKNKELYAYLLLDFNFVNLFINKMKSLIKLFDNSKIKYEEYKKIIMFLSNLTIILKHMLNNKIKNNEFDLRSELSELKNNIENTEVLFDEYSNISSDVKKHIKTPALILIDNSIDYFGELFKPKNESKIFSLKSIVD